MTKGCDTMRCMRRNSAMGRPKNETVAKYHKEHLKRYCLMFRRDEDADLIDYITDSDIQVSELFRLAMRMYMEEMGK